MCVCVFPPRQQSELSVAKCHDVSIVFADCLMTGRFAVKRSVVRGRGGVGWCGRGGVGWWGRGGVGCILYGTQ